MAKEPKRSPGGYKNVTTVTGDGKLGLRKK
jgi:hypothetical protein